PESVVLPQDRFSMRVLQPSAAGERMGARFYLVDARGKKLRHLAQPLEPGKWVELQWFIPANVMMTIGEIGLEFRPGRKSWTGVVCIDHVEQQRPVEPRR